MNETDNVILLRSARWYAGDGNHPKWQPTGGTVVALDDEALGRLADACPECLSSHGANVPLVTVRGAGVSCLYVCRTCTLAWWTAWAPEAFGITLPEAVGE